MIQRNEDTILVGTDIKQCFIAGTLEILIPHRHDVVTGQRQQLDAAAANILIQLDPHSRQASQWNRQDTLARHLCAIGDSRHDVPMRQLGIIREQFGFSHAIRQKIQDQRDPKTGALDAGLSTADVGVDGNAIKECVHG
ncbi:MAG: hypothetical protein ABSC06_37870 [Rhodopila sp.]|jgi:hypothetical protein